MDATTALKPRVLIADDAPDILGLVTQFIELSGVYRSVTAKDGKEAIEAYDRALAEDDPFCLMIIDAAMPEKSGFEVAEYVRKGHNDVVPIIVITAHDEPINAAHLSYVRGDDLLTKPFDSQQLRTRMDAIFALHPIPRCRAAMELARRGSHMNAQAH